MTTAVDDELWSAVGDPTRRRLLDLLLRDGPGTATSLSREVPVTRQAVAKHLVVLDRVGLVRAAFSGVNTERLLVGFLRAWMLVGFLRAWGRPPLNRRPRTTRHP